MNYINCVNKLYYKKTIRNKWRYCWNFCVGEQVVNKLYLKSNQILTKHSNSFPSWYANRMIFLFLLTKINSNFRIFSTSLSLFSTFSSLSCISLILCHSLLMIDSFSCFCICPFRFFASMFVSGMLSRFWN